MQLVPHEIRREDSSETEPILLQPSGAERLEESTSSIAIRVAVDSSVAADDTSGLNVDEDISLVRPDQPQCRICLDIEGLFRLFVFLDLSLYFLSYRL